MTRLASSRDLQALIGASTGDFDETRADAILDLISDEARDAAKQTISQATTTAVLCGNWSKYLELPERPVNDVTVVQVNGTTLATTAWEFDGLHSLHRIDGGTWLGPTARIGVTYDHGSAVAPGWVRSIVLKAAQRAYQAPGTADAEDGPVLQETSGPFSRTYARTAKTLSVDGGWLSAGEISRLKKLRP